MEIKFTSPSLHGKHLAKRNLPACSVGKLTPKAGECPGQVGGGVCPVLIWKWWMVWLLERYLPYVTVPLKFPSELSLSLQRVLISMKLL